MIGYVSVEQSSTMTMGDLPGHHMSEMKANNKGARRKRD